MREFKSEDIRLYVPAVRAPKQDSITDPETFAAGGHESRKENEPGACNHECLGDI